MKKTMTILLIFALIFSMMPGNAFAAEINLISLTEENTTIVIDGLIGGASHIYDGNKSYDLTVKRVNVQGYTSRLQEGEENDYVVVYKKDGQIITNVSSVKDAGVYTIEISGRGLFTDTVTKTLMIEPIDLDRTQIIVSRDITSSDIDPTDKTKLKDDVLWQIISVIQNGSDITDSYENFTSRVTGNSVRVTVQLRGDATKTKFAEFDIRTDLSGYEIVSIPEQTYTGKAIEPTITVRAKGSSYSYLTKGTHYTVAYTNNVNAGSSALVTVTGIGAYTGTLNGMFTIGQRSITSSGISITVADAVYRDGGVITPAVIVTDGTKPLVQGTDYMVRCSNTAVGTATAVITGIGNYKGQVSKTFNIVEAGKELSPINTWIYVGNSTYDYSVPYNGRPQTPAVTVLHGATQQTATVLSSSYYNVTYTNNDRAGQAIVTITGKNGYAGTVSAYFTILPTQMTQSNTTISGYNVSYAYTGADITPAVVVSVNGYLLTEGKHYTVEYSNNRDVTKDGNMAVITVRAIEGSGYTGMVQAAFRIVDPKQIYGWNTKVKLVRNSEVYDGMSKRPMIESVTYGKSGHYTNLSPSRDYIVSYLDENGQVVTDMVEPGQYRVVITGRGEYIGSIRVPFVILPADMGVTGGENLDWKYDESGFYYHFNQTTGTLTIGGYGPVRQAPWVQEGWADEIRVLRLGSQITEFEFQDQYKEYNDGASCSIYTLDNLAAIEVERENTTYSSMDGVLYNKQKTELVYYPDAKPEPAFVVPKSVESLYSFGGVYSFEGCRFLEQLSFENGCQIQTIPYNTFKNCKALKTVELPVSVVNIEGHAFYGCESLTQITIPASVQNIEYGAFAYTTALKKITLPKSLDRIQGAAFLKSGIAEVSGFENVREVGYAAFQGCKNLTSLNISNRLNWVGRYAFMETGLETAIFPAGTATWDQLRVVPTGLFKNCKNLKNVSIPEGIETISNQAFEGCTALTAFDFPTTLTYLGARAFYGSGIQTVVLPDGIAETDIQPETFANSQIETLSVSGNVRSVGYSAFENCLNLTTLNLRDFVSEEMEEGKGFNFVEYNAFKNCRNLLTTGLLQGKVTVNDEDYVKNQIGYVEPSSAELSPDGKAMGIPYIPPFVYVGSSAYENCKSITGKLSLLWPTLCNYAFAGCSNLNAIDLNGGCTDGQELAELEEFRDEWDNIPFGAFQNCTSLETVVIPEHMGYIYGRAFEGCSALKSVQLPANLKRLGARAFYGSGVENIEIPGTLSRLEPETFSQSKLQAVNLPENVRAVGYSAFEGCKNLTSLDIEKTPYIYEKAFMGCDGLKQVVFQDESGTDISMGPYGYLGEESFAIPNLQVTFEGQLPRLYQPFDSTAKIKVSCEKNSDVSGLKDYDVFYDHVFEGDTCIYCGTTLDSLEYFGPDERKVKYPIDKAKGQYFIFDKTTGAIDKISCFDNVPETIVVPEKIDDVLVEKIGKNAFYEEEIKTIVLPKTIKQIEGSAFNGSNLQTLTLPVSADFTGGFDVPSLTGFIFKEGSGAAVDYDSGSYQLTPWYVNRKKEITITFEEGITRIGDYTFAGQQVTAYQLPASLKEIGDNTFYRNKNLTAVSMKEGVEEIGYQAFAECKALQNITLPTTLTSMEYNSFAGDEALIAIVYKGTYAKSAAAKYGISYKVNLDGPVVKPIDPPDVTGQGEIEMETVYGLPGAIVEIPVKVTVNPGMASLKLMVDYDKTALKLVGTSDGDDFDSNVLKRISQDQSDILVWNTNQLATNVENTGILVTLSFQVLEQAANGDYRIELTYDPDNTLIATGQSRVFNCHSGQITVADFIYGDVNDSSDVNINDADYVAKYIAGWMAYQAINQAAADVDVDSKVTLRDAAIISRHVAGWLGYETMPNTANPLPMPQ
ncbi:MAG: leucine-rich repeat protein [Firmicutes bacterium]|nr:leucine-rich repeat protein [Bacillota bacterium]